MPRFVRLRLEKIQRDFLWGGETLDSKPHLVKWDTVCFDRRKGGLGVRRLHSLNKALLCKWICCFASEREAFWRQSLVVNMGIWKGVGALRSERRLWCWFMEDHKKVVGCS